MRKTIFFLFFSFGLFSNDASTPQELASLQGDVNALICGCVNAITGDYIYSQADLIVQGAEPIPIRRRYLSSEVKNPMLKWKLAYHTKAVEVFEPGIYQLFIPQENGSILPYSPSAVQASTKTRTFIPTEESLMAGIICLPGTHSFENRVEIGAKSLKMYQNDGTKRTYHQAVSTTTRNLIGARNGYILKRERLPNGNRIFYKWDKKWNLTEIISTTPSGSHELASIKVRNKNQSMFIDTSDGHTLEYKYESAKKTNSLVRAHVPNFPMEKIRNNNKKQLKKRIFPDGREVYLKYDKKDRVRKIQYPGEIAYRVEYEKGLTKAIDQSNHSTSYFYHPESLRLEKIEYPQGQKTEVFTWTKDGFPLSKTIFDSKDEILQFFYEYDKCHNLTKKTIQGKITSLDAGEESYSTSYLYDEQNRLIEEKEDNGNTIKIAYLGNTSLPTSKGVWKDGSILKQTLYEYNYDNILTKEIVDDFTEKRTKYITPRKATPFYGLPESIEELGIKTCFFYDKWGNHQKKEIYDSKGEKKYSLITEFNEKGQLIFEQDAMGNQTRYEYDKNGNLKKETKPQGLTILYEYDVCNRLTKKIEVGDSKHRITQYQDYKNQDKPGLIIDPLGGCTKNIYDVAGNLISTTDPKNATTEYKYNVLDHQISTVDPYGNQTIIHPNIFGDPLCIEHPDNTKEYYTYNLDGTKATYTDQNGTATKFTYDEYGNICLEEIYSEGNCIGCITRKYSAFHLLEETNLEGYKTIYKYNVNGQLIEKTYENETTTYTYDSLGRQITETTEEYTRSKNYDLLDRVIVRKEWSQGKLLTKTCIEYAPNGRSKTIIEFPNNRPAKTFIEYDSFLREKKIVDPEGNETNFEYQIEGGKLKKNIQEPGDIQITESYNSLDELLSTWQAESYTEYKYDLMGNKIFERSSPSHSIEWTYDEMGRKKSETESDQKTTSYTYTKAGELESLLKPDGTLLTYHYDSLGNLTSLSSSRGDINYAYTYDKLGNLTQSQDLVQNTQTSRLLDPNGNPLQETLANGFRLISTYDALGRRKSLALPNHQTIYYTYEGPYLHSVTIDDKIHIFEYDLAGNLLTQTYFDRTSTSYTYNQNSLPVSQIGTTFTQDLIYDARSNITEIITNLNRSSYTYDNLDHILTEPTHAYTYDFLHNRTSKDNIPYSLNSLNQLTSCRYDPNGNLLQKGEATYTYDSLDRLIQVITPQATTTYTYDSENRRLTKNRTPFIWDGDHELGTLGTYRILGSTDQAEIGSAIAIYENGELLIPIHDLLGNLIQAGPISQSFTAFGEGIALLPWGFSSKRHDPESHLIYFGHRYYDPELGRFLTPDPEGYTDSANLYTFALNNPITNHDPYGLFIASSTFNLVADDDLHQMAAGAIHGITTPLINTGYGFVKYTDLAVSTIAHPFTNSGLSLTETLRSKNNFWDQERVLSHDTMRSVLGGDLSNPYYATLQGNTNSAIELAFLATPVGRALKEATTVPRLFTVSKVIPEVSSSIKAKSIAQGVFHSNTSGISKSIYLESINSKLNLNRKLSQLESAQKLALNIRVLKNGRIRYYGPERVAFSPGPTRGRSFVTEFNPSTGKTRTWMECYNQYGKVNRVHPKQKNGRILNSPHYPPTYREIMKNE